MKLYPLRMRDGCGWELCWVPGKKLEEMLLPGIELITHHIVGSKEKWGVSDVLTGFAIVLNGESEADAVRKLRAVVVDKVAAAGGASEFLHEYVSLAAAVIVKHGKLPAPKGVKGSICPRCNKKH